MEQGASTSWPFGVPKSACRSRRAEVGVPRVAERRSLQEIWRRGSLTTTANYDRRLSHVSAEAPVHVSLFPRSLSVPSLTPAAVALAATATALLALGGSPASLRAQGGRAANAAARNAAAPTPGPDVFLVPIAMANGALKVGVPANLTHRDGYDNQPSFAPNSQSLYYTSNRGDGQSDIYAYDLRTGLATPVRHTVPESEYSAFPTDGGKSLAVIRVEADSTQRLWRLPLDGSAPSVLFPDVKPVGYFAQADDSTWAMFVLGSPATLQVGVAGRAGTTTLARDIGRSLHRIPGTTRVSFVQKSAAGWYVMQLDPATRRIDTLVKTLDKSEDMAWIDSTTAVMGQGTKLFAWRKGTTAWTEVADLSFAHLAGISRLAVSPNRQYLAMVADVTPRSALTVTGAKNTYVDRFDPKVIQHDVDVLAADSMEGRYTGARGGDRAMTWIASQFKAAGLTPAGDSNSFFQRIPLQVSAPQQAMPGSNAGRPMQARPAAVASWAQWDSLPAASRMKTANVVGVLPGADATLRDEVVLVTAHFDHIGMGGRAVDGDSINNGADDDASGVTAIIEMAKALRQGPKPKRTIVFMAITGEEIGGFGTRWYIAHPVRPLEKTVVDLNVEMIAHPDSLAGGFGKAWLTGYERSTMGDLLADNGIPLVADPRPGQNFFQRSDNVAFARIGIPAHSLSSFNTRTPYHDPKDEPSTIDAQHMAQVIGATAKALRLLADGPRPEWHPGGKPDAPAPRPAR